MTALVRSLHFALLVSWLALTLGVWWVATNSFEALSAEKNPVASKLFEPAPEAKIKGRMAAREVNTRIFRAWNRLQFMFCVLLFCFLWWAGRMSGLPLVLAGCLLLIVGVHIFWFTPKIEALGRILTLFGQLRGMHHRPCRVNSEATTARMSSRISVKACILPGPWRYGFLQ